MKRLIMWPRAALALTACAMRPDGDSVPQYSIWRRRGGCTGDLLMPPPPPQGLTPTYMCFTQPYGGGGTTTCLQQPSIAVPPSGMLPSVRCFTQQTPYGGGATTTCLPH